MLLVLVWFFASVFATAPTLKTVQVFPYFILRWHHALAYGGFIRAGPIVQQPPPLPSVVPSSEAPSTPKEEMLVNVSAPGGMGFDGFPTIPERHNG